MQTTLASTETKLQLAKDAAVREEVQARQAIRKAKWTAVIAAGEKREAEGQTGTEYISACEDRMSAGN